FDESAVAPLFAPKIPKDSKLLQAGLYDASPSANYVAIFQRLEPEKKHDKPVLIAGMRATTVVAGFPIVVTIVRFDGHDTSIYKELLASAEAAVNALRDANAPPPPAPAASAHRHKQTRPAKAP